MTITIMIIVFIDQKFLSQFYGARPIKRWIEKNIMTTICKMLVNGEASEGSTISIDSTCDKKGLKYQLEKKKNVKNP
jgi:ATP-dependent Clp protease ATP-binding subunit ClpA